MKREEDQGQYSSQAINTNNFQSYQEQILIQQQQQQQMHHHQQQQQNSDMNNIFGGGRGFMIPHEVSQWSIPPVHSFNQNSVRDHDQFLVHPPPVPSPYSSFFNRRVPSLQFAYHHDVPNSDHLRMLSDTLGPMVQPGSVPFGLHAEMGKMNAQEIMDAKALAQSKSHSEAERRRRERINNHLAKLRSLLPNTTKTDKASLLAEVIQHVKELKRQTSLIEETSPVPTECDELTLDTTDEDGKFVIKASLCCEDRSDLLPDLIKTLKSLRLRTLKAEITTLGGRVKNVLFITGDNNEDSSSSSGEKCMQQQPYCISSIQEALKAVMEKNGGDESASGNVKRQRTNNNINIIEQRSL